MFASQLELPGSPFEQSSQGVSLYTWDPSSTGTGDLTGSETPTSPTAKVWKVDPSYTQNQSDWQDVSSTTLVTGYPQVVSSKIQVALQSLTAGFEYICLLTFTATATSHLPSRYLRIRCKL